MQELVREGNKLTAVSQLRVPSPIPVVTGSLWEPEVESDGRPQPQLKLIPEETQSCFQTSGKG